MKLALIVLCVAALIGCAPVVPSSGVRDVRDRHIPENAAKLRPGLTPDEVAAIIGPSWVTDRFANGTTTWTYRYDDYGVQKLLHVVFGPSGHLASTASEWDPSVYSKIP
jgi:outer membrane protein assembly factor BamE (lipoprotein component of BamABCDE complex)